ncbi:MAG: response regulator transcription factor [Burkholderiales bacterium]
MAETERTYRLTEVGREISKGDDLSVPGDYRRILALVKEDTHFDVIRGALRRYPDKLIVDWLAEIQEMGFLEIVPSEADLDLDFTKFFAQPIAPAKLIGEDAKRIKTEAKSATAALKSAGAWIAEARLRNRPALAKSAGDMVVLIVEDDPDQLALADLRVSLAGYKVRIARNAAELLADLRTQPLPDILLLDVMLPDGNGFEILGKLRKHPKLALLLVALLTARDQPQEIAKGLALGADAYITKPYSKKIFADTIGRILKAA